MIDNWFEFELNGVKYKGKSVGGDPPLRESGQALRAQNAQLVQGEDSAVFNMRPDVLVFKWTDWSGGEGQFNYDPEQPNRYWHGQSINAHEVPGTITAGPAVTQIVDESTSLPLEIDTEYQWIVRQGDQAFLIANEKLYVLLLSGLVVEWTEQEATITGRTGTIRGAVADNRDFYFMDDDSIIRLRVGTFADFSTSGIDSDQRSLRELGNFVYVAEWGTPFQVYEYDKTDALPVTPTVIFSTNDVSDGAVAAPEKVSAVAPNRVYYALNSKGQCRILEIIPTTAAAAGSGAIIGMVPAEVSSICWSGGLLFLHAFPDGMSLATVTDAGLLMYFNPADGTYGVVDQVSPAIFHSVNRGIGGSVQDFGQGLTSNFFIYRAADTAGGTAHSRMLVHDTINGGLHSLARIANFAATNHPWDIQRWNSHTLLAMGDIFATSVNPGMSYILWGNLFEGDNFDPYVISSAWDFGLVDDKILSSIRLLTEPIPEDWTVKVDYQLDESGTWVEAGTAAEASTGGTFTISTDSSTKQFGALRLRITMMWGGSGHPDEAPVVLGVEARAQVSQKLRSWTVILDCSDDQGQAQSQSLKGHQKIDNIQTAGTPGGNVVAFKNGFSHRQPNSYDEYDVIVDDYEIFMLRPGEGYAVVRLIEVA